MLGMSWDFQTKKVSCPVTYVYSNLFTNIVTIQVQIRVKAQSQILSLGQ